MKQAFRAAILCGVIGVLISGCARGREESASMVPAPTRGEQMAMDSMFRTMMNLAENSPEWIRFETMGEIIYLRPKNPERAIFDYPGDALDRIERITIDGGVEAVGLKRYIRASGLEYDRSTGVPRFKNAMVLPNKAYSAH